MPPTGGPKLPAGWPRSGTINFNQVVMKYAPHLPPALRGVSFNIKSGDKVGVVGRTGRGKSTLLLALYRMFNLESGAVTLDGVDISTLTLEQLRRGLSVIPQDPAIFSGTVRSNLDPFGEFGHDAVLWEALRDCGLEEQVKACGGLDAELSGTGGNAWSIGQAQLMCLARAALKKVPVLCLDEATAAMDPHTEAHVLEIIEKLFSDRTTLTIAHRCVVRCGWEGCFVAGVLPCLAGTAWGSGRVALLPDPAAMPGFGSVHCCAVLSSAMAAENCSHCASLF